ncbi:MAG: ATP-binding cassette domain-containing protein [Asgard group archaeon]|nr:ATP-binding cassette domain-containing protein [Asgard group archaeon]
MIDCQDVIKIYSDPETNIRVAALRGIDMRIRDGELISIIGPSGSGKSTLIKILAGIESISSGIVNIGNFELGKLSADQLLEYRLKMVGLVHQFPERTLFLSGTVMDNLMFASGLFSKNKSENKIRNRTILKKLDIHNLENRRVAHLSGGEMIRTALACILAKNAPLLLCDEPTGQLDSENTARVKDLLREITRDYGTTVLVVTHDLRFLKGVDRTCEIHNGRVSSLYDADAKRTFTKQDFPLKLQSQIDSSQSARIPNEIYDILQLEHTIEFQISENSRVEIVNPKGIHPKPVKIKEQKKLVHLKVSELESNYFKDKPIDIQLSDVSKIYGRRNLEVHALSNVNLKFYRGELAFIIGPSGSGKTTLLKLITGIEPISKGSIDVLGHKLADMNDADRARFRRQNIGIVSQQGNLHPYITVTENLFLRDILSGKNINYKLFPQNEIKAIFDAFQIEHRKESYPLEISGGELQRASLAIAKYGSPGLYILDEPTANMDSELADQVINQLYKIHKQLNNTLLITTHDRTLVKDGTRVIELKDGTISSDGLAYSEEIEE